MGATVRVKNQSVMLLQWFWNGLGLHITMLYALEILKTWLLHPQLHVQHSCVDALQSNFVALMLSFPEVFVCSQLRRACQIFQDGGARWWRSAFAAASPRGFWTATGGGFEPATSPRPQAEPRGKTRTVSFLSRPARDLARRSRYDHAPVTILSRPARGFTRRSRYEGPLDRMGFVTTWVL